MHLVFIGLVNKLSYDFTINPAILTDGILWFKDLSSPDPTGILPVLGGLLTFVNIINTSSTGGHKLMRKGKKFMKLIPFVSVPIWMTFPFAFNLYWLVTSGCQGLIQALFRVKKFRVMMGIP
jgi:membrane protein insertase Oxa1/YidC/SpoIIIJ